MSDLKVYSLRLTKGAELKESLINYAKEKQLSAPFILTCVGSVSSATLRYASQKCGGAENVSNHYGLFSLIFKNYLLKDIATLECQILEASPIVLEDCADF